MKKHFITGLIILLPVALTLMVIVFLFDLFTEPFIAFAGPWLKTLPLPGGLTLFLARLFSLIILILFIFLLGFITQLFLIKTLIHWAQVVLTKIPLIKTIYQVSRDVFGAIFSTDGKKAFKRPVMIPFPNKPNFAIGFAAGEVAEAIQEKMAMPLTSVFTPTAPHPISGFLFLVPTQDVRDVDMTNEEVLKFLVSCGMILPESEKNASDDYF